MSKKFLLNIYDFFCSSGYQIEIGRIIAQLDERLNLLIMMRLHKKFFKDGDKLRKSAKVEQIDFQAEIKFIEHSIKECIAKFFDDLSAELDLEKEMEEFKGNRWKSEDKVNE